MSDIYNITILPDSTLTSVTPTTNIVVNLESNDIITSLTDSSLKTSIALYGTEGATVAGQLAAFTDTNGTIIADSGVSPTSFATALQGAKADTAIQPGDLGSAAYTDISDYEVADSVLLHNSETLGVHGLGTAASHATEDFQPAGSYVTSVTAGNGLTQTGSPILNPTINVVGHSGTPGSTGTLLVGSDSIGVNLGTTSITACAGNDSRLSNSRTPLAHNQAWSTITSTPTTLDDYGITDAATAVQGAKADIAQLFHGFPNRTDTTLSFNNATQIFTLGVATTATVYVNNIAGVLTSSKTVNLNTYTLSVGQWFIWLTSVGFLAASKTAWDILDTSIIPVATVHWDGTQGIISEERHSHKRNLEFHNQAHFAWGAQYIAGFTAAPTFGAGAANTFSFVGGITADEDIRNNTATLDSGGSPHTNCMLGYRATGAATMVFDARSTTYAKLNAGVPQYDNVGVLTNIGISKYGVTWIYATNRLGTPIVGILGQGEYTSLANAQAAAQPILAGMTVAEWKLLYRVVYRNVAGALQFTQADVLYNTSTGPAVSPAAPSTIIAGNVVYTPTGSIAATNVQSAIDEIIVEAVGVAGFAAGAVGTPSVFPAGDINTGRWFPAADTIAESTNGAERMRITSAGNILVGTSTDLTNPRIHISIGTNTAAPSYLAGIDAAVVSADSNAVMHVQSKAASGGTSGYGFSSSTVRSAGYIGYNHSTNEMEFRTNATGKMWLTSSGNLQIGSSTPTAGTEKLQVTGSMSSTSSLKVGTGFGCNGKTPQTAVTVNAACTDLATAVALINQLRAALIANGIVV